jgi:hypothetical protein
MSMGEAMNGRVTRIAKRAGLAAAAGCALILSSCAIDNNSRFESSSSVVGRASPGYTGDFDDRQRENAVGSSPWIYWSRQPAPAQQTGAEATGLTRDGVEGANAGAGTGAQ